MNRLPWPPHGIHPAPLTDQVDATEDHLSSYGQPLVLLERIRTSSRGWRLPAGIAHLLNDSPWADGKRGGRRCLDVPLTGYTATANSAVWTAIKVAGSRFKSEPMWELVKRRSPDRFPGQGSL